MNKHVLNKLISQEYKLYLVNQLNDDSQKSYSVRLGLSDGVSEILDGELNKHFFINYLRTLGYNENHLSFVASEWKMCGGFATKRHVTDILEAHAVTFPTPTPFEAQVSPDSSDE